MFLHGAGESGTDLNELLSEGATGCPPVELAAGRACEPLRTQFATVAPQTDRGWGGPLVGTFVDALLADKSLRLDPQRVYCTGVSMGGYGCWNAGTGRIHAGGSTFPRFAAIVPVCGAGQVAAEALAGVPVWAWHGANDSELLFYSHDNC